MASIYRDKNIARLTQPTLDRLNTHLRAQGEPTVEAWLPWADREPVTVPPVQDTDLRQKNHR